MTKENLIKWRNWFGWTQAEMGQALGRSRWTIVQWEKGNVPVPAWTLLMLQDHAAKRMPGAA